MSGEYGYGKWRRLGGFRLQKARGYASVAATALAIFVGKFPRSWATPGLPPKLQAPAWVAPRVPPKPAQPVADHGARIHISSSQRLASGLAVPVKIMVSNHGVRPIFIPVGAAFPSWTDFPGTWCWGPSARSGTTLFRWVRDGYRRPQSGSAARILVAPGRRYLSQSINLSRIFDLTIPGRYEAQLSGMGMISNVIKFRVLPPNNKPTGPAIMLRGSPAPKFVISWGPARHGVQLAAYAKLNPNGSREIRVHLFVRNVAHNARTIRLTGNPEVDFAKCRVVGPCFGHVRLGPLYRRINNQPAPLTAYGKLMVKRNWGHPERRIYTLQPGRLYEYWRPLLLNRRFDLSVYGPYRFSARLAGTRLKTGTLIICVGVQPREYNMPLFNRWLTAWKKKHGVE